MQNICCWHLSNFIKLNVVTNLCMNYFDPVIVVCKRILLCYVEIKRQTPISKLKQYKTVV